MMKNLMKNLIFLALLYKSIINYIKIMSYRLAAWNYSISLVLLSILSIFYLFKFLFLFFQLLLVTLFIKRIFSIMFFLHYSWLKRISFRFSTPACNHFAETFIIFHSSLFLFMDTFLFSKFFPFSRDFFLG